MRGLVVALIVAVCMLLVLSLLLFARGERQRGEEVPDAARTVAVFLAGGRDST
jgi:hypothetical protein